MSEQRYLLLVIRRDIYYRAVLLAYISSEVGVVVTSLGVEHHVVYRWTLQLQRVVAPVAVTGENISVIKVWPDAGYPQPSVSPGLYARHGALERVGIYNGVVACVAVYPVDSAGLRPGFDEPEVALQIKVRALQIAVAELVNLQPWLGCDRLKTGFSGRYGRNPVLRTVSQSFQSITPLFHAPEAKQYNPAGRTQVPSGYHPG